jgi:glucokinase
MLLAGDVGGTKTDLAIFLPDQGLRAPMAQRRFHSANYPGLAALVREFLASANLPVEYACFDVAGPLVGGRARLTNLPWVLEEAALREALRLKAVWLINDLFAIASAVPHLGPADLHTLNAGVPVVGGALAVVAPGTGVGEAFLTWDGTRYRAHPSEGGHANFAAASPLELEVLRYLQARFGQVSVERVCSGIGIPNLYDALQAAGTATESPEIAAELAAAADRTPVILRAALDPAAPSKLCAAVLDLFVGILGSEAGDLALKVLAAGGVYLAGGIPRRIIPALERDEFRRAFQRKGRLSDLLATVPVHVIIDRIALLSAARYGLEKAGLAPSPGEDAR